jgi:serine protease inhibitor ecotin
MPQALAALLVLTQIQAVGQATPAQAPAAQEVPAPPQAAPAPAPGQPIPETPLPVEQNLKVRILAGNGEMNDLERHVMAPLVVQVVDQNERAMEGAQVIFRFPISGPSATFPGGKSTITVLTNGVGQAAAVNWMANGQVGTFQVHVNATYGNQVGEVIVSMSNVTRIENVSKNSGGAKHEGLWSHRWFKIAVIGGAALAVGLGVYLATRGGGKSGTTVGVSPGPPTVSN